MLINISIAPHNYEKWKVKNYYWYKEWIWNSAAAHVFRVL